MTKSPLFNQIQADCCGRVVECRDDAEATALGAWISAAVPVYRRAARPGKVHVFIDNFI